MTGEAEVRELIRSLSALYSAFYTEGERIAHGNAMHALDVLADVLGGADPSVAGMRCTRCSAPLRDGPALCVPAGNQAEPWRGNGEPGVCEMVCVVCFALAGGGEAV